MVFINCPFLPLPKILHVDYPCVSARNIKNSLMKFSGVSEDFFDVYNGCRKLSNEDDVPSNSSVYITFTLPGGKGGFGSMLRAIGAQIEKTTNREACRDLSGRRLRDINEEQRMKKWLEKKMEREKESERRRRERIQRLKEEPKHEFHDNDYNKQRSELPERIDDALSVGLKRKTKLQSDKKPLDGAGPSKQSRLWNDMNMSSDESDEELCTESSDSNEANSAAVEEVGESANTDSNTVLSSSSSGELCALDNKDGSSKYSATVTADVDTPVEIPAMDKLEDEILPQCDAVLPVCDEISQENIDLMKFENAYEFEVLGLEKLKEILMRLGLKCGGTLTERAQRLWTVRGLDEKDYPASLKAKVKKGKSTN